MTELLPWSLIQEFYANEWVELVDCVWGGLRPHPKRARVRHHAADRVELLEQVRRSERTKDATIMLVSSVPVLVEQNQAQAVI